MGLTVQSRSKVGQRPPPGHRGDLSSGEQRTGSLKVRGYKSEVTGKRLHVTGTRLQVGGHMLQVRGHML